MDYKTFDFDGRENTLATILDPERNTITFSGDYSSKDFACCEHLVWCVPNRAGYTTIQVGGVYKINLRVFIVESVNAKYPDNSFLSLRFRHLGILENLRRMLIG